MFATLCNLFKNSSWKSIRHSDGEACFGGDWFIVGIDTPEGVFTYHYQMEYWNMFNCEILDVGKEWDGHNEDDVDGLLSLAGDIKKDRYSESSDHGGRWYRSFILGESTDGVWNSKDGLTFSDDDILEVL